MDVSTSEETVILIDSQDSHQNIEDNSGNTAVAAAATAGTATSVEQPQYVTLQLEDGTETLGQVVHVSEDGQATVTFVQEINAPPGELNISQEQQPIADTSLKTFDEKTSTPVLDVYPPYSVVEPKEVNFPEDEEENFEGSPLHKVPEKRTPGGAVIIRAEDLDLDSNDVGNTDIDQHTTTQIVRQAVKTYRDGDTEFSKTYLRDYQSLINLVQKCKEPQCGCHKYHCPMCDVQRFKPAFMHKLTRHLKVHWENRISYKDGGILRCSRSCIEDLRGVIHYHCPECPRLFKKRKNIVIHLVRVHEAPPSILRSQSQDEPTKVFHTVTATILQTVLDYIDEKATDLIDFIQQHYNVTVSHIDDKYILEGNFDSITQAHTYINDKLMKKVAAKDLELLKEMEEEDEDDSKQTESKFRYKYTRARSRFTLPVQIEPDSNIEQSKNNDEQSSNDVFVEIVKDDISSAVDEENSAEKSSKGGYQLKDRTCNMCGETFHGLRRYSKHIREVHNVKRAPSEMVTCELCGKSLRKKHLKQHVLNVHKKQRPHVCQICNRGFTTNSYLQYHLTTHKDADERTRPYLCPHCGRGFYRNTQLQDHINGHTGNKPYTCKLCDKSFPYRSALHKHYSVHEEKLFRCSRCSKTFKNNEHLEDHMRSHETDCYPCLQCGEMYDDKQSLTIHTQNHCTNSITASQQDSNQPQYMCGYCQNIFPDLSTVQEHLIEHVSESLQPTQTLLQSLATSFDESLIKQPINQS
ncbi:uncharacterized protein LOC141901033 isoform X1 [Tubulanus polymorphus]|uniref:uncharacterized protein LOC141901033 isoform X1 n=1 Tax=Tubulanus polymorphus TaxID=672921 RepID=UPI003DA6AE91